jgi:hypothetical protein
MNKTIMHHPQNIRGLKMSLGVLISIVVISFANYAIAQQLWDGTSYGMSKDDVLKVVPGARIINDGDSLAGGAKELIRAEHIKIVNELFNAKFFFFRNKLDQVTLSLRDKAPFHKFLIIFNSLTEALRSKYGSELAFKIDKISLLKRAEATWMVGKTNINVLAMTVGDHPAILNINYQIRISKDAEKL